MAPPIEIRALRRVFGPDRCVLDDVSFRVDAGELVALTGRNGAGKTTVLDIIATMLLPSGGEVRIDGRDVTRDPAGVRARIGYAMAGAGGFYGRLTGRHNLEFYAALQPSVTDARARVSELSTWLELEPFIDRQVRHLSDGMRQKLALARALAGAPSVLLLDEPMRALDIEARHTVGRLLNGLVRQGSVRAVLYVTHEARESDVLGGRVILLEDGRVT